MAKRPFTTSRRDVLATIAPAALAASLVPLATAADAAVPLPPVPGHSAFDVLLDEGIAADAASDSFADETYHRRRAVERVVAADARSVADLRAQVRAFTLGQRLEMFNLFWVQTCIVRSLRNLMREGVI